VQHYIKNFLKGAETSFSFLHNCEIRN